MEELDRYVNWLINQQMTGNFDIPKKSLWRKIDTSFILEEPEELETVKRELEKFSEEGYFSKATLERIKSLPSEKLVDIYLEIEKKIPRHYNNIALPIIAILLFLIFLLGLTEIFNPGAIDNFLNSSEFIKNLQEYIEKILPF